MNKPGGGRSQAETNPIYINEYQEVKSTFYVDFDHSLLAANSTELYLNHCRPYAIVGALLAVLELLAPWRLGRCVNGTYLWRDPIRVWLVRLLMPWTILSFRRAAPRLFERYQSASVSARLAGARANQIVVVSFGFRSIIQPLLRGSAFEACTLVASTLTRPTRLRIQGKLQALETARLTPDRGTDVVITDSPDDQDLLNAVHQGVLIEPQHSPMPQHYVPLYYLARFKRTPRFVTNQTLLEELPIALLITVLFLPFAWSTWISAGLLFGSFLLVYEIGYAENDRVGARTEQAPKPARDSERAATYPMQPWAWLWSLAVAGVGIWMLSDEMLGVITAQLPALGTLAERSPGLHLFAWWVVILVASRLVFVSFNHAPIQLRLFLYPVLQISKYGALVVLFGSQLIGYGLLGAQVVRLWMLYLVRRSGGDIERIASQTVRLVLFIGFVGLALWATPGWTLLERWELWLILAWCTLRAVPEARRKLFGDALHDGMIR